MICRQFKNTGPVNACRLPLSLLCACRRHGIPLTRFLIVVRIETQTTLIFERTRFGSSICRSRRKEAQTSSCFPVEVRASLPRLLHGDLEVRASLPRLLHGNYYSLLKRCRCSTSKFGIGQEENTNRTPLGLHRVTEKIGGGWPVGAVFRGRRMVGYTWQGLPGAPITNRILWLDGLEPGFNRGGQVDSHARYIYIHGTGDEPSLGRPVSHGCVQLGGADLLPLYDWLPVGTLVWIER
jgi:hypothetical protein